MPRIPLLDYQDEAEPTHSWNEWTDDSYLLPDIRWVYRYPQAVRTVFWEHY